MTQLLSLFVVFLMVAEAAQAQVTHSQEIEIGTDGQGGSFVSDYIMFDTPTVNGLLRPFWVNNTLARLEIGVGPTFTTGRLTHKLQFGGTTDRELMFSGVWLTKVANRQLIYIADFKPALGYTLTSLYQKAIYALDKKSVLNLRYEQLNLDGLGAVFVRPGIEVQFQFSMRQVPAHIFVAPFYDPKVGSGGAQVGLRFFELKLN